MEANFRPWWTAICKVWKLFSVHGWRKSRRCAGYFPSRTDWIYFPSMVDGKVGVVQAIFRLGVFGYITTEIFLSWGGGCTPSPYPSPAWPTYQTPPMHLNSTQLNATRRWIKGKEARWSLYISPILDIVVNFLFEGVYRVTIYYSNRQAIPFVYNPNWKKIFSYI